MNRRPILARIAAGMSLAAMVLGSAMPSHAYRLIQNTASGRVSAGALVPCGDPGGFAHWTTPNTSWYNNTGNQGADKAAALQNAMASWTNVAGASHVLTYAGTTTAGWATDSVNTVLWASGNGCTNATGCLALTALVLRQPGQEIIESDITFNNDRDWRTNGTDFDTQAVATHEFGHALGIHHTEVISTPRPTMFGNYFGTDGRTLETDDRAALQCSQVTYGCNPAVGAPLVPASLNVMRQMCYGINDLQWSPSAGATRYELYRSSSPSFTTQQLVYSGSGTFYTANVSSTTYFRVRACNASGCSCYRVGNRAATYYPYCL